MVNNVWDTIIRKTKDFNMSKGITSFVNPYSMLILKEQVEIAKNIDNWHVDGISLVNALNDNLGMSLSRFSFDDSSIAPVVFEFAKLNNLSIAIIGTKEEFIHRAVDVIESKHGIRIDFYRNGYFNSQSERDECLNNLFARKIDIVICGMGTPYQEKFLIDLKKMGWNGYGFTCGGYLHQISRKENYYPEIFNKLNIRWVYRILDEPKLFRRYLIDYPKFFLEFNHFKKGFKQ